MSREVELLRRAASLMRSDIGRLPFGPWISVPMDPAPHRLLCSVSTTRDVAEVYERGEQPAFCDFAESWRRSALAVAELIEVEAERLDSTPYAVDSEWIERNYRAALALARDYLGEVPDAS